MALRGQTHSKILAAVQSLTPFKIGNVSGTTVLSDIGRLPQEYVSDLQKADDDGTLKYVLYSYWTPMAWLLVDETGEQRWVQPEVKYSVSTTNHQTVFATATRQRVAA